MDDFQVKYVWEGKRRLIFKAIAPYLPYVLFVATMITTLFAGALMQYIHPRSIIRNPALLLNGAPFAVPLMVILLTHEMGHFIASKVHRVRATLPHFIPFPNYIGTFGALIVMRSPMRDRRSLLDIGAAGPLAGFVLSVIAAAWGLSHAHAVHIDTLPPDSFWTPRIAFGPNLAFYYLMQWFGPAEMYQQGYVIVNPVMDAGWLGLFVTSLNLMPAGQLDGGHIAYAMLGRRGAHILARMVVGVLVAMTLGVYAIAIVAHYLQIQIFLPAVWIGYLLWAVLIMIIGVRHPPPMKPWVKLDPGRKVVGALCLFVWIVTFSPTPFGMF